MKEPIVFDDQIQEQSIIIFGQDKENNNADVTGLTASGGGGGGGGGGGH